MIRHIGWNSVTARRNGDFSPIPAGGYLCIVKTSFTSLSKNGNSMLVLSFDIAEGDFARKFSNTDFKHAPKFYQLIYDSNGNVRSDYKALVEDFAISNSGINPSDSDFDERVLVGKKIGVVFGDYEYLNSKGDIRINSQPRKIISVDDLRNGNFIIPSIQSLDKNKTSKTDDDFSGVDIPDNSVPF